MGSPRLVPLPAWVKGCRAAADQPRPPGLLWQLRPSDVEVELLAHTRRVVSRELEEETGLHTGWIQNGGLFIASSRQRLDEYKRLMSVGAPRGVRQRVLWGERVPWGIRWVGVSPEQAEAVVGRAAGRRGRHPSRLGLEDWCCPLLAGPPALFILIPKGSI